MQLFLWVCMQVAAPQHEAEWASECIVVIGCLHHCSPPRCVCIKVQNPSQWHRDTHRVTWVRRKILSRVRSWQKQSLTVAGVETWFDSDSLGGRSLPDLAVAPSYSARINITIKRYIKCEARNSKLTSFVLLSDCRTTVMDVQMSEDLDSLFAQMDYQPSLTPVPDSAARNWLLTTSTVQWDSPGQRLSYMQVPHDWQIPQSKSDDFVTQARWKEYKPKIVELKYSMGLPLRLVRCIMCSLYQFSAA